MSNVHYLNNTCIPIKMSKIICKQRMKVLERTKHKYAIDNENIHAEQ